MGAWLVRSQQDRAEECLDEVWYRQMEKIRKVIIFVFESLFYQFL